MADLASENAVGLVFGGRSVEHQVSIRSARTVAAALGDAGFEVRPFGIALDGAWVTEKEGSRALLGEIDTLEAPAEGGAVPVARLTVGLRAVFPINHGTWGEDGTIQGLFEMLDVPYVGAGVAASAVAMDKGLCKRILASAGLPVVDWEFVTRDEFETDGDAVARRVARLDYPLFVKPSVGGSSVGVKKVPSVADLESSLAFALRFDDAVVVERSVEGRELECSVLGHGRLESSVVGEIVPAGEFYDYADKYLDDAAELRIPAPLDEEVADRLRTLATGAFGAIGGSGMARVDFLMDSGGEVFINEINTLPGFTSISMYPKLWEAAGLPIARLVARLVDAAVQRHRERQRLNQSIRDWTDSLAP